MASVDGETCFLSGDLRGALSAVRVKKACLEPVGSATCADCTVYDTFDAQLAWGDRVFYASNQVLHLIGPVGRPKTARAPVPGLVADLPEGALKQEVKAIASGLRAVLPKGVGRVWQQGYELSGDNREERAGCVVRVIETSSAAPVTCITIQAIQGHKGDARTLAKRIKRLGSGVVLNAPEVLDQLAPGTTAYRAKPEVVLTSDMTLFDVANALIAAHIAVMRANEPGIVADHDTEFLHDYRVALRKIRSVLSLFRDVYSPDVTDALKIRFAGLMAATSAQRDLDVYLIDRPAYLAMVPEDLRPGVNDLFEVFAEHRARAFTTLVRHLQGERYLREIKALEAMFADPETSLRLGAKAQQDVATYAQRMISKRYRRVRKMAGNITTDTPDDAIHALRIQCKKLRYLMEFFAPLYGKTSIKLPRKALKDLQEVLGTFNDSVVQQDALKAELKLLGGETGHAPLEIAAGIGGVLTVLHQRRLSERAAAMAAISAFDAREIRQQFKDLTG